MTNVIISGCNGKMGQVVTLLCAVLGKGFIVSKVQKSLHVVFDVPFDLGADGLQFFFCHIAHHPQQTLGVFLPGHQAMERLASRTAFTAPE